MICNLGVVGSNPTGSSNAAVAQLVEHNLAKVRVAGSNPVCRSIRDNSSIGRASSFQVGGCRFESCLSLKWFVSRVGYNIALSLRRSWVRFPYEPHLGEYINWLDYVLWEHEVVGSSPASPTEKFFSINLGP